MSKKKRVTLRDVARQAGVSPTAVSFAYNAPHQLSQITRERILETADALGYQPHPVARTLATGRTNTIGLVMPTGLDWILHDPLFSLILGEIGSVCDEEKMRILIVPAAGDISPGMLATIAADGFVLFSIHRDHPLGRVVERTNRPLVMINGDENLAAPMFNVDDVKGAYIACQHLLEKGHRRIAVGTIGPREDGVVIPVYERRMQGYQAAVRDAGLPPSTLRPVFIRGLMSMGTESFEKIWSLNPRPTAALCVSDVRALAVLNGARKAGVSVPNDLAVVGFDNLPESAVSTPPLTTLSQDLPGRVRLALSTLFALINDENADDSPPPPHINPLELLVREST
ncbi:MAG: LacI family transcriptional regulator [Caldilineaceae bacterium]|nr:LacI family transcriptional regulator [Caldilineaceae bacterium]HRJ41197.1 LacI family DNA-binding transcriptional regulator [Caldilineaceae bacterium]